MIQQVRILIADGDENECERISNILEAQGYAVKTSKNGKLTLFDAIEFHPHVFVINILLPKMDGVKVLEQIRANALLQNTPVILYSKHQTDTRGGMDAGADDVLIKPFTDKELLRSVKARLFKYEKLGGAGVQKRHEVDTDVFASYYHEFNTLLHGILGGTNLLINANGTYSENQTRELLFSVLKSGLRLNHSLSNLLLLEEIKRADTNTELITMFTNGVSQRGWVNKIIAELQHMATEMYNRAADLDIRLQDCDIRIKPEYLLRIFIELTDNALKFSKPVQKVIVKGSIDDDNYVIKITDHGKSFPLQNLDAVAPYKQFSTKKYDHSGLGIGLYLVKRIVMFNFGDITVKTNGDGSTFTVSLPLLQH